MRGFYKLPQGLKVGKNSDGEAKNVQIRIFKNYQLWKKKFFEGLSPSFQQSVS